MTEQTTAALLKFLKGAVKKGGPFKKPEYHGLFSCGTFARFQISEDPFVGFDGDEYDFPTHRLLDPGKLDKVLENNQKIYQEVMDKKVQHPQYVELVNTAYNTLINAGYPYPGGEGGDRIPIPLEDKNTWLTVFTARDPYVLTITDPSMVNTEEELSMHQMVILGGDARRNDYMEPRLVALITPDLQVLKV
jgi:hypothetical protein